MTLNIKAGDWAVLRNGEVRGPLEVTDDGTFPISTGEECLYHMSWTEEGWEYLGPKRLPDTDIIATLPCPPLERIAQLEDALRFYAKPADYEAPLTTPGKLWLDCGETARTALGEDK